MIENDERLQEKLSRRRAAIGTTLSLHAVSADIWNCYYRYMAENRGRHAIEIAMESAAHSAQHAVDREYLSTIEAMV